jgi:glycosyltransferase involved in cell wall biosynthesis
MCAAPRVTLGVTTFNNERYLPGAFDAVLAQDFQDFEVVVCDNQSTDATWDICQTYAEHDRRFRIHRNERNLGFSGNYSRVVGFARGEYFRLTSHDDRMATTLLSQCVAALDANPQAVLAYPRGTVIDAEGNDLFPCENEPDIRHPSPMRRVVLSMQALVYSNALFGLIRTDVLRKTRLLGPFGTNDQPLLVELAARGDFCLVPEWLFFRRGQEDGSYFGGTTSVRERYEWLEPGVARTRSFRVTSNRELSRIAFETIRALARNELPLRTRLGTTAAFCVVWPTRLARVQLGKWKGRLMRRTVVGSSADRADG